MNFLLPMGVSLHEDDNADLEPASFHFKEDDVQRYTAPEHLLVQYDPFERREAADDGVAFPPLYNRAVSLEKRTAAVCAYHPRMYMSRRDQCMFECWFQQMQSSAESVVYTLEKAYAARDAGYTPKINSYLRIARGSIFETLVLLEFFPDNPFVKLLKEWKQFLVEFDVVFLAYVCVAIDSHTGRPLGYTKEECHVAIDRTRTTPLKLYCTIRSFSQSVINALSLCALAMPSTQWNQYAPAMMKVSKNLNSVLLNIQEGYAYLSVSKLRSFLCIADGHMRSVYSSIVLYRDGVKLPPGIHAAFCHEASECMETLAQLVCSLSMRPNGFPHELAR